MTKNIFEILDDAFELSREKRFHEAATICDYVIKNWPHAYAGYYRKANVFTMMGDHEKAVRELHKVVELLPDDAFPYQMRGEELYKLGQYERALTDFEKADELDQGFFGHDIKICKAACLVALGRREEAAAACRDVPDEHECLGFYDHPKATKRHVLGAPRRQPPLARRQGR